MSRIAELFTTREWNHLAEKHGYRNEIGLHGHLPFTEDYIQPSIWDEEKQPSRAVKKRKKNKYDLW